MTEPDVTLTDYALMILCVAFVRNIAGQSFKMPILHKLWCVFFGSVALASLMGGTVHGFFLDESSLGFQILWPITLLAVGVTAGTAWVLSGLFAFGQGALKSSLIFCSRSRAIYRCDMGPFISFADGDLVFRTDALSIFASQPNNYFAVIFKDRGWFISRSWLLV